jgi:glycosyltransferase involved in cell wall biosynthesis
MFDARHLKESGIGTYISKQIPLLEEHVNLNGLTLAIIGDQDILPVQDRRTTVIHQRKGDDSMYSLQEQRLWDRVLRKVHPRALWLPHYPFPLSLLRPTNRQILLFVTVHDTIHLEGRTVSGVGRPHALYMRTMLQLVSSKSTAIFAASNTTCISIKRITPRAPAIVAPHPVDSVWLKPVDADLSPVQEPYILFVGNAKYHKNLPCLLGAYREIASDIPHRLVIAGGGDTLRTTDDRIHPLISSLDGRVELVGRLAFDELRALVARAALLVMPSLIEGVGMPPLEAMASRTAVLSSDIPALRETCGSGAEYFNPTDHHALARLIHRYCLDDAAREELAARGYAYVATRQSDLDFEIAVRSICDALRP